MKIFEITQPQNVTEPEEPQDQQPEVQAEPQQAPAEPQRKPRYKWQTGPMSTEFGSPEIYVNDPETGKMVTNPEWLAWRDTDPAKAYDTARDAHFKSQLAAMHQYVGASPDDFDLSIDEFPNPYFKADGPEDEEDPNYEPELISIGVDYEYSYHGKYYAATQIDPAEYPELEISISRVIDLENGEDITKKVNLQQVEEYIEEQLPSWEEEAQNARDDAAIDRYEANRDYYDESMSRIKKLSGL